MLSLITTYKIVLTIDFIVALNNFNYEWIINDFCKKKLQETIFK